MSFLFGECYFESVQTFMSSDMKFIMHVITVSHKMTDSSKSEALRLTNEKKKTMWLILMYSQLLLPYLLKLRDKNVGSHRQL